MTYVWCRERNHWVAECPPQLTDMKPKMGKGKPMEETEAGRWGARGRRAVPSARSESAGLAGLRWRLQYPWTPTTLPNPPPRIPQGMKICHPGCCSHTFLSKKIFESVDVWPQIYTGTLKYFKHRQSYSPLSIIHANEVARLSERHRRRRKLRLQECSLGVLDLFWFSSTNQQEVVVIHILTDNEVAAQRSQ